MSKLYRWIFALPGALAGLFISAFAGEISSRILSFLINRLWSFESNRGLMLIARDLEISHSNDDKHWVWGRHFDSRFKEVVVLLGVKHLEIEARINLVRFSPETNYAAFLIFQTTPDTCGLDTFQEALVSVGSLEWKKVVCIKPKVMMPRNKCIGLPVKRSDEWVELELGQFYSDDGPDDQEVVVSFKETTHHTEKMGLIVVGIELRPI